MSDPVTTDQERADGTTAFCSYHPDGTVESEEHW